MIIGKKHFLLVENAARHFIVAGLFLYLGALYFVDTNRQNTIFYLSVALPGLLLLGTLKDVLSVGSREVLFVFVFLLYLVASSLWSGMGVATFFVALKYSFYLACLMLSIYLFVSRTSAGEQAMTRFFVLIGFCASLVYLFFAFRSAPGVPNPLGGRYALHDLSGWGENNPITSAVFFGLPVLAAWWRYPDEKLASKIGLLLLMIACMGVMFLTKSRGPFLALAITLLFVTVYRRNRSDIVLWAVCGVLGLGFVLALDLHSVIADRVSAPDYRMEIWSHALALISERPIWGYGYGSVAALSFGAGDMATHSHSSILEVLRVGGIAGGTLFLAMVFLAVRKSLAGNAGARFFLFWLIYGVICLSTNGRMLLSRPSVEWFAFWIPLFFMLIASGNSREPGWRDGAFST
ncbi:O-antigen ligase family protein [Aromatoleum buckelii]|uniref:O-antigen ligase-related domain-containing protein n=1 Tax=Aromatoleum buckelii TaxID=200254 RepID=A0ABX1MYU6_9RHOO|nr:O-antigen ligase family protein [Aromatoleum buckelii]MCK0510609.1 O-antigen ligase family protein [Aromatoleum buckelii]